MADDHKELVASCHCGHCCFTTSVPSSDLPLPAWLCHCHSCRHISGNICTGNMRWPGESKHLDLSSLSSYDFSPNVRLTFCPHCGTNMFWQTHGERDTVRSALTGVIKDASDLIKYTRHDWLDEVKDGGAAVWLDRIDGDEMTKNRRGVKCETIARLEPSTLETVATGISDKSGKLHAECRCGGGQLDIARPHTIASRPTKEDDWWHATGGRYVGAVCVCESCRLSTGTPFLTLVNVPTSRGMQSDGRPFDTQSGTIKRYRGSNKATRAFCSRCGAFVYYAQDDVLINDQPRMIEVGAGLLCGESGSRADECVVWKGWKVCREEDSSHQPLTQSLKAGLRSWAEEAYGADHAMLSPDNYQQVIERMEKEGDVREF